MAKTNRKTYTVGYLVQLWIDQEIMADSLEQALSIAQNTKENDVVSFEGACNDSRINVVNVGDYNHDSLLK